MINIFPDWLYNPFIGSLLGFVLLMWILFALTDKKRKWDRK